MKSRIAELEANNMVLQGQMDKASESEMASTRELQRKIDRGEHELTRMQEKVRESDEKFNQSQSKVATLEREILNLQDSIFRKDRSSRELKSKIESLTDQREQLRESLQLEIEGLQTELKVEKEHGESLVRSHQKEIDELRKDVETRIPSIVSSVANDAELHFNEQLQNEMKGFKARYARQLSALKNEMFEMQSAHQETIIRLKSREASDKVELEDFRQKCSKLETKNRQLSAEYDALSMRQQELRHVNMTQSSLSGYNITPFLPDDNVNLQSQPVNNELAPPPDALSSIASQLSDMRTQLNRSMNMRTAHLKMHNDRGFTNRGQLNRWESNLSDVHPKATPIKHSDGKENVEARHGARHTNNHQNIPFTTYTEKSDWNSNNKSLIPTTPPSKKAKPKISAVVSSPERLFDSPMNLSKVRLDDSGSIAMNDYRYQYHNESRTSDYDSETQVDSLLIAPPTSDFSSIQDGGFHEGYWKAKYLVQR